VIARHLIGELQRRQRLEQREDRAAEQSGLLAGDDRDGASIGEEFSRVARTRRRLAALLLPGDDARDLLTPALVALRAGNRVGPGGAVGRIAREERGDGRKIVGVVGRQPANPRKATDVDGNADERLVCRRRRRR